jgi:hypothetical protein
MRLSTRITILVKADPAKPAEESEALLSDSFDVCRGSGRGTRAGAELVGVDSITGEVVLKLPVLHRQ